MNRYRIIICGVIPLAKNYWIGVDLGGTKILAGVFDDHFKRVGRAKLATAVGKPPEAVIEEVHRAVEAAIKDAQVEPAEVRALGMCIPGQVDQRVQTIRYAPNLGWRGSLNSPVSRHRPGRGNVTLRMT